MRQTLVKSGLPSQRTEETLCYIHYQTPCMSLIEPFQFEQTKHDYYQPPNNYKNISYSNAEIVMDKLNFGNIGIAWKTIWRRAYILVSCFAQHYHYYWHQQI